MAKPKCITPHVTLGSFINSVCPRWKVRLDEVKEVMFCLFEQLIHVFDINCRVSLYHPVVLQDFDYNWYCKKNGLFFVVIVCVFY